MYGFNILCEISKVLFEIYFTQTLNPYTTKYAFYEVLKIDNIYYPRVILSIGETGPCNILVPLWPGEASMLR